MIRKPTWVFVAAAALAAACSATVLPAQARVVKAIASFTVLADMVRTVGGDKVEVASLVGPGGDPHSFEPTPNDARNVKEADIVFVNGLGLEGWLDRLIAASGTKNRPIVASNGITVLKTDEDGRSVIDPHAWNAAANGIVYIRNIATALAAVDPDDAKTFQANATAYEAELKNLDADAKREAAAVPTTRRKILTTHDALGYFAKAYGIEILSPLGISTDQEPSASAVAGLIRQIEAEHIHTFFLESSNDRRLIEQIARATGAHAGGELYVEALSPPGGPAATYLAMFRHNLELIVKAMREQV